jgi:hypothetical protein
LEVSAEPGFGATGLNSAAAFKYVLDCFVAALLAMTVLGFNRRVLADSHPGAYVGPPR